MQEEKAMLQQQNSELLARLSSMEESYKADLRAKDETNKVQNCQNIGSEEGAEKTAFMHSLIESCPLNGKDPFAYLYHLFQKLKSPPDDMGKRDLLPDRWMPVC